MTEAEIEERAEDLVVSLMARNPAGAALLLRSLAIEVMLEPERHVEPGRDGHINHREVAKKEGRVELLQRLMSRCGDAARLAHMDSPSRETH